MKWYVRRTIDMPEKLFFSAMVNTMRAEGLERQECGIKETWAAYNKFYWGLEGPFDDKKHHALRLFASQLQLRYHFARITLPAMSSGRGRKGKFLFKAGELEAVLGDGYNADVMI